MNSKPRGQVNIAQVCAMYYWKFFPAVLFFIVLLKLWTGSVFSPVEGGQNFLRYTSVETNGLYGHVDAGSFTSLENGAARILITGAAGFIGSNVIERLKNDGIDNVVGIDNFNDYYSPELKHARADRLAELHDTDVLDIDVCNTAKLTALFVKHQFTHVLHLAAQPGVRYSRNHPQAYVRNNVECFVELLEVMVHPGESRRGGGKLYETPYLVYASSSSVYGLNSAEKPFAESDRVDRPSNLYGATKRGNEQMALAYHNLYGLRSVGCRFFTVYGPWGRPDMALHMFADAIDQGKELKLFNGGHMSRDFTFVADIVDGIVRILQWHSKDGAPEVFNLGNKSPVKLLDFVQTLEKHMGKKANIVDGGESKGEVTTTFSDVSLATNILGFSPKTNIDEGIKKFVDWYISSDRKPAFSNVAT